MSVLRGGAFFLIEIVLRELRPVLQEISRWGNQLIPRTQVPQRVP